jgi:MFS family permease
MALTACALGALTLRGSMSPSLLLLFTSVIGAGGALAGPAYQAIVPDLVPRGELLSAVSLNSMGFHLARAIGPALGGVVVAAAGPGANFVLNGVSFISTLVVLGRNAEARQPASARGSHPARCGPASARGCAAVPGRDGAGRRVHVRRERRGRCCWSHVTARPGSEGYGFCSAAWASAP